MPRAANRFTIYDALDAQHYFDTNPANQDSRDPTSGTSLYQGPVQYPRMMYHPQGVERVVVRGERVKIGDEWMTVGEQKEIIYRIVNSEAEEKAAVAEGWHHHAASAMRAAGKEAPATGADQVIADLERKLKQLQEEKDALEALRAPNTQAVSDSPLSRPIVGAKPPVVP